MSESSSENINNTQDPQTLKPYTETSMDEATRERAMSIGRKTKNMRKRPTSQELSDSLYQQQ